jgi:hypothetical protein
MISRKCINFTAPATGEFLSGVPKNRKSKSEQDARYCFGSISGEEMQKLQSGWRGAFEHFHVIDTCAFTKGDAKFGISWGLRNQSSTLLIDSNDVLV